jgi:hypothetical protein
MTRSFAIVGAGLAGVGAADALRETDVSVTILEKSRGVGGRAATRRRNGCTYDHGANYVKDADERTADLIRDLGTDGLVDVSLPVWTFDADGTVSPGADRDAHKWTWEAGITQFAKRVLARTDADLRTETRVAAIDHVGGWLLVDDDGREHGPFDGVLLTPPAPQTAALLAETNWSGGMMPALREAVGSVPYRTVRTLVLHYPFEQDRPWYGLVDTSKDHAVGWVSREECKPGHVPDGESLLVVQMGPDWSTAHYDDPTADAAASAAAAVAELLDDEDLEDPDWVDDQRWRYALPDGAAPCEVLERGTDDGLYFAGDWVAGEARAYAAFWDGHGAGERVDETL